MTQNLTAIEKLHLTEGRDSLPLLHGHLGPPPHHMGSPLHGPVQTCSLTPPQPPCNDRQKDPRSKILDASPAPIFLIFMQFSGEFGQITGWRPLGFSDPHGKSWIRRCRQT